MYDNLTAKARAGRISALASLPNRTDNIISLSRIRATRDVLDTAVQFVSVRPAHNITRLAA